MGKHHNKEHRSELEQLRSANRKLKSENRNLKKRLKSLEKREHLYDVEDDDEAINFFIESKNDTCPACNKGPYVLVDLLHVKFLSCGNCDYREKVK